jgi:hypothetical protein
MSLLLVLGNAGPVGVTADWNATEGGDVAAFAAVLRVDVAWAALEAGDNAAFVADLRVNAVWAAVEGSDTAAFTGTVAVPVVWNATEGQDVAAFAGNVAGGGVSVDWNAQEGGDSVAVALAVSEEEQSFFPRGGGPFIPKYGYFGYRTGQQDSDDDLEHAEQVREVLDSEGTEVIQAAVERAASAIRNGDAEPVLDAERIYSEAIERIRGKAAADIAGLLARDRVASYWRAEVRKKLQERDDEDTVMMIAELL